MPRDLITSMMYGRLAMFIMPDGRKLWPVVAQTDVSDALDTLSQRDGDTLIRRNGRWTGGRPLEPEGALPPMTLVTRSTELYCPADDWRKIPFESAVFDPKGRFDAVTGDVIVPEPGLYLVGAVTRAYNRSIAVLNATLDDELTMFISHDENGAARQLNGIGFLNVTGQNRRIGLKVFCIFNAYIMPEMQTPQLFVIGPWPNSGGE